MSDKVKKTPPPSETTVITETVTLAVGEANTPAGLVVDRNGLFNVDEPAAESAQTAASPQSEKPAARRRKKRKPHALQRVLKLARRPENLLFRRYYKSRFRRKLLKNYAWYRDLESEQALGNRLENVYGGTNNPLRNMTHFARNNILVSTVVLAVTLLVGMSYLSQPAVNLSTAKTPTPVAKKVSQPAANKASQPAAVASNPDGDLALNHCSVTDILKKFYDDTGDQAVKNEVIAEVSGFIKVYRASDIEQWYAERQSKRDSVISQVQNTLSDIRSYRQQTADEIKSLMAQRAQLNAKLDAITFAGRQSLDDINRSIKLRTQLANVEAQIMAGPSSNSLSELDRNLQRLEDIIAGNVKLPAAVASRWAVQSSELERSALTELVADILQRDIYASVNQVAQGAPEARSYRLRILSATVRHIGDLIAHLINTDNYRETQVGVSQHSGNKRLHKLLGNRAHAEVPFLSYGNCLNALNIGQTKLTMQMQD